jgi:hypothetical protein
MHHLQKALQGLLDCPDLNVDSLDSLTLNAIEDANEALEAVSQGRRSFKVRYARLVIMETFVLARDEHEVARMPLPEPYDGIPTDDVPPEVQDVIDHEHTWEVTEA